jgi:probable phosphoglycerate mutase
MFLLVRHGVTEWNKDERFRGRSDLSLTDHGLRQAEAVAQRIAAEYHPAALYSGPLTRAVQTAEAISRATGLPVQVDHRLLDLDYGDFAGLSAAEAAQKFPQLYRSWLGAPHTVHFPHGETLVDVKARTDELIEQVRQAYPDEQVVLVSHLVVCRVLLCSLLGLHVGHFGMFEVSPASLSFVRLDDGHAKLIEANNTCHLTELAVA